MAAAASSSSGASMVRCIRRIRCPIDHLIMQPLDKSQVNARIKTKDAAIVTFLFPVDNLQRIMHRRYEAEAFHDWSESESTPLEKRTKLGFVTLIAGKNIPLHQSRIERWIDPAPHPTLSLRITVMDRIHWQRTSWLAGSICNSLCWGRFPKAIFNIPLDWKKQVKIDAKFDEKKQVYEHYHLTVPEHNFSMTLQDTGKTLFDPDSRIVEGFLDNESALKQLGLAREVDMHGLGNSVYRQTLWSTPSLPNVANMTELQCGSLFEHYFQCATPSRTEPVATWLVDEVKETMIYQMEGHVEDENDPSSATTFGERSLVERVQKKAMNRYSDFRDEVRGKTYSDIDGRETPR